MQTRHGNTPKNATGLIHVKDGTNWNLYRMSTEYEPWINLKLVHAGPVEGSANYWLGWHTIDKRMSNTRDAARLAQYRPDLSKWVSDVMATLYKDIPEEEMALEQKA